MSQSFPLALWIAVWKSKFAIAYSTLFWNSAACVQMPSLSAIEKIEQMSGLPSLSASVATTWSILNALDLTAKAPGGGALLAGY